MAARPFRAADSRHPAAEPRSNRPPNPARVGHESEERTRTDDPLRGDAGVAAQRLPVRADTLRRRRLGARLQGPHGAPVRQLRRQRSWRRRRARRCADGRQAARRAARAGAAQLRGVRRASGWASGRVPLEAAVGRGPDDEGDGRLPRSRPEDAGTRTP